MRVLQQIVQVVISRAKKLIGRISVLPFFFLLLFSSCFKSKFDFSNSNESKNYLKDSLFLQLDSKSSYDFTYFDLGIIEGKEKLIVLNQINSSVDFYNLSDGELESRFIIQQDGPAQIRDIQGLLFHNKDSIFVFTSFLRSRFGLFNMEGELKSYYKPNIYSDNLLDQLLNHSSSPTVPTVFLNGKLFFSQLTLGNPAGNPVFSESHVPEFIYHLKNDSIEQINNLRMPLEFRGKTLPFSFTFQSKAFNSVNDLVFSWFGSDNFKETLDLLHKMAEEMGIDLEAAQEETESYLAVEEAQEIIIDKHPLNELADQYLKLGRSWIESPVLQENLQQWQSLVELGTLDISEAQANLKTAEEAMEVIQWYLFFITVKIKRALHDQMDDFWEEYPDEERSDLGTAKIASIAIERSIDAWTTIYRLFPLEEQLVEVLAVLEKLRGGLLEVFPNYPKFIRPGFDSEE